MTKNEAIIRAGGQTALAKLLGITRGAVWQWKAIPMGRIYQLRLLRPEWFKTHGD
jgi:predicted transcriptional regulator